MPFKYDKVFLLLKERGITSYKIRKENLISQAALTKMKNGEGNIDTRTLERLCELLHCQPGDLLEYVNEASENSEEPDVIAFTVRKGARELLEDEAHCCGESLNDFLKEAAQDKYYNESGERIEL